LIIAYRTNGAVNFRDLTTDKEIISAIQATDCIEIGDRFYVRQVDHLLEVVFIENGATVRIARSVVAGISRNSTKFFDGVVLQSMLGAYYASIVSAPGVCHQVRLAELDRYRIIDARLESTVLILHAAKGGKYDRLIFRFSKTFDSYDLRVTADITPTEVNFTVLDNGTVLLINENDELEIFSCTQGALGVRTLVDQVLAGGVKLFSKGNQAMFSRWNKLFSFKMRTA